MIRMHVHLTPVTQPWRRMPALGQRVLGDCALAIRLSFATGHLAEVSSCRGLILAWASYWPRPLAAQASHCRGLAVSNVLRPLTAQASYCSLLGPRLLLRLAQPTVFLCVCLCVRVHMCR